MKLLPVVMTLTLLACAPAPIGPPVAPPVAKLPTSPILLASATQITRITNDPHEERWIDINDDATRMLYTVIDRSTKTTARYKSFMMYLQRAGRVPLGAGDVDQPTWIPEGDDYVATVYTSSSWRLAKKNVKSPKTTFVSSMTDSAINAPSVSPDGQLIAFEVQESGASQIATVMTSGAEYTLYGEGATPRWRPDGQALVYIFRGQIYELDLATGTRTQLTYNSTKLVHYDPVYSPDGEWIAFGAGPKKKLVHLWVMKNDGSARTKLSDGAGEWKPNWPSTGHIYFVARTRSGHDVWRITPRL